METMLTLNKINLENHLPFFERYKKKKIKTLY